MALVVAGSAAGGEYNDNYKIPGVQSQAAIDRLQADFPAAAGSTNNQVVFHAPTGTLAGPKDQAAIAASLAAVQQLDVAALPVLVAEDHVDELPGRVLAWGRRVGRSAPSQDRNPAGVMQPVEQTSTVSAAPAARALIAFIAVLLVAGCQTVETTKGGTVGVGRSTTSAVVMASIIVIIADFVLARALQLILGTQT